MGRAQRSRAAEGDTTKRRREKIGHEAPGTVLRGPPIAITCACGQRHSVPYGTVWTCPDCARVWDTSDVPREDYEAIRRITLRFRALPVALGLLVATIALFFILTGNTTAVFVLLPLTLMVWFTYLRDAHRRRYRAALAERQRWTLDSR
jgi:hypothetical protein